MSIALASTLGFLAIAGFWLLIGKPVVGLLFPFFTIGLMIGIFFLTVKYRKEPGEGDPQNMSIQLAVIGGGLISTLLFYATTGVIPPRSLGYSGGLMALVALLWIAIDQIKFGRLNSAAEKAWDKAEEARRLAKDGDYKTADEMYQEALLTSEIAYGSKHPQVATIVYYMAELMKETERDEAASVLFRRAVDVRSHLNDNPKTYVQTLQVCADHLRQVGNYKDAISYANRALIESKKLQNARALTGRCALTQSRIYTAQEKMKEAYEAGKTAAKLLEKSQGKSHPDTLEAKALMASHSVSLGRVAEAERILVEVISEKEKLGENEDEIYLGLLMDLSAVHSRGSAEKSKHALIKAAKLLRVHIGREYHRAEELIHKLPAVLAEGHPPALEEFYQKMMVANETRAASLILEQNPDLVKVVDASGWTTLQWAVFLDNAELTRVSLSQGADIEAGKDTDYPALYIGTRWANRAALSTLYRKDPDVEITAVDGSRPIHGAVLSGDQLTFDQTCSKKATLEVPNKKGWTPLHLVAYHGLRKFLLQLLPKGMNVNFQAPTSMETPLHAAILGGQRGAAETLLLNMAQVDLEDANGDTAADLAAKKGDRDILELMEGYADIPDEEEAEEEASESDSDGDEGAEEGSEADGEEEPEKEET